MICTKCNTDKPLSLFYRSKKSKTGRMSICTECCKAIGKVYRESMKARTEFPILTEKKCCDCGKIKLIDNFYRAKARKDGYTENCIECRERRRKDHEKTDPDVYKKRWGRYYSQPENIEKNKKRMKKYREKHPEEIKENSHKAYEKHKDYYRTYSKAWYKTEKGLALVKKKHAVRRLRCAGENQITAAQIRELEQENREKYGVLTCVYCVAPIKGSYHLEHRIPLSRGGENTKENATISCPTCNVRKHKKTDVEFMAEMGAI